MNPNRQIWRYKMALTTDQLILIARALSDPIRLKILELIQGGYEQLNRTPPLACSSDGVCVNDLQSHLNMGQSKISYHLKELKNAGLVKETRTGKWNFYCINYAAMDAFHEELRRRFQQIGEVETCACLATEAIEPTI